MGLVQSPTVMDAGAITPMRGGIIDIYPPGDMGPGAPDLVWRLVLDGGTRFEASAHQAHTES